MLHKIVFVQAEIEKNKERIGKGKYAGSHKVKGYQLATDIEKTIAELNSEGYEVITITPIISGRYSYTDFDITTGGSDYGFGYSYTEGIIIVAKLRDLFTED